MRHAVLFTLLIATALPSGAGDDFGPDPGPRVYVSRELDLTMYPQHLLRENRNLPEPFGGAVLIRGYDPATGKLRLMLTGISAERHRWVVGGKRPCYVWREVALTPAGDSCEYVFKDRMFRMGMYLDFRDGDAPPRVILTLIGFVLKKP